ncbi:hypothetical protein ACFQ5M_05890 [Agrilactobacillus yilanensis]|uniref:Uncharacterized protein n=1 Tax=Agrilactobacillus yilanensis TaxID=2485997 RepID=A0ABW4J7H2_9LACO|nr:hypothetical protein [Agrilactobacillus yilanensis]
MTFKKRFGTLLNGKPVKVPVLREVLSDEPTLENSTGGASS